MTTLPRALEMVNKINYSEQPFIDKWREIYYRMSIHTTGACPRFFPLGDDGILGTTYTYPQGWLHARYDYIFDTHILNKHPREPRVTRQWRKSVYRPYQMAPLLESIGSTSATIFGDSKYTLIVEDKEDNDYIQGNNFDGKSFVGYFEWMFKAICEDPNSLFVVQPKLAGYETPAGAKVEPMIKHIRSVDLIYIDEKEILYYEWDTPYAWFVNELGYFRFQKMSDDRYYLMDASYGYYAHMLTYKPAHFAGGIWNTNRYYDSYLKPAQAFCDDFASSKSDLQMINKEACHPFIVAAAMDCPSCNGHKQDNYCLNCNHQVMSCDCSEESKKWVLTDCHKCHGSGQMSHNPADWTIVPKEDMVNDLIKVIQFDVEANKYLSEEADKIALGIKKSLSQDHIEEAQSGVAKDIDRQAQYLYRSTVSNGIWGLMEKCLIDVLSLRNTANLDGKRKPDIPKYILIKPTDFDLKTECDLLEEYKESTDAKTPDYVRQKQMETYIDKVFGGDELMVKMSTIINEMDSFSVTSTADKIALLAAMGISQKDFQFSNELPKMLKSIVRNKGSEWFLNADYNAIETEVNTLASKLVPLEKPPAPLDKPSINPLHKAA